MTDSLHEIAVKVPSPLQLIRCTRRTVRGVAIAALLSACGGSQTTVVERPEVLETAQSGESTRQSSTGWAGARAYSLGAEALDTGNYPAAVVAFTWAIEEAPDRVEPWLNRAIAYVALRRFADADRDIERALLLAPESSNVALAAASRAVATLRYDDALELLDAAEVTGAEAEAELIRGWALAETGYLDDASRAFNTALQTPALEASSHCGLARVAEHRGQLDVAIASYEAALAVAPQHRSALRGLGLRSLEAGRPDAARRAFDALLRELPDNDPDRSYIEAARSRAR
ncbi:MAG: tetratricopeptide (TPR) repeat protein [Bradymonadia bacterium]|jgi:tetratricopeptide (TPR) repeat protein